MLGAGELRDLVSAAKASVEPEAEPEVAPSSTAAPAPVATPTSAPTASGGESNRTMVIAAAVTASRRHLRLEPADFGLIVEDLSSANGTYIDDDRITEAMVVQAGNVVRLGETELIVHEGHATEQRTGGAASSFGKDQRVSEESRKLVRSAQKLHRPGQMGRPPTVRPGGS